MPYLLQAALQVGLIGALVGSPLALLIHVNASRLTAGQFDLSTPVVLFFLAATTFASMYTLLPRFRRRSQVAGMCAGLITYCAFLLWLSYAVNVDTGWRSWGRWWRPFQIAFIFTGWVPLIAGWIAGSFVSELADAPAEERH